ncbi:MAG: helix-turn-helix domain-containing protein [Reyranella sp.]
MSRGGKRGPYRKDRRPEVDALMVKRKRLNISIEGLAERSGISRTQLYQIKATGLAFDRQLRAIAAAIRAIEREAARDDSLFGGVDGR